MADVRMADPTVRAEVLAVEARRIRALIDGDVATLDELFDDSIVHIHAPGLRQNKAQLLEHVAVRRAYLDIERGELDARQVGDVVVLTGTIANRLRTAEGGERRMKGIVTQVLNRADDGSWRYLSFQMTPFTEQAWGALPSEQQRAER